MEELLRSPAPLDDDAATLDAALAFIDAHYGRRPVDATVRARNSEAAARTHRKHKAERLRLREECAVLQATVDALTPRVDTHRRADSSSQCNGNETRKRRTREDATLDAVVAERERARDALAHNRRLREALETQRGLGAQLVQVLRERMSNKVVQDLLQETAVLHVRTQCNTMSNRKGVLDDLEERLQMFSSEANNIVASVSREIILSESRTQIVHREGHGSVVESMSSVQIPCELNDGWAYLMDVYCGAFAKINRREYGYTATVRMVVDRPTCEKDYSLVLKDTKREEPVHVDGLALFETYSSPDLKLFVWASLVSIRGDNVQVRECGWTAMTRAIDDPQNSSVLHQRHELHCASGGSGEPAIRSKCPKTRFLAQALLQKSRRDRDNGERALTQRFGTDTSCVLPVFGV